MELLVVVVEGKWEGRSENAFCEAAVGRGRGRRRRYGGEWGSGSGDRHC